jgi:bisphosphoglycerate-independent phosphoglycerate mutase (AlkP superfamily)
MEEKMEKKTTVLMILDGFGLNDKAEGNAVKLAKTPVLDGLMQKYPFVEGYASGLDVGLPDGQFRGWASEYGRRACRLSGADTHHKSD